MAEPDHAQFIQLLVRHEHDLLRFVLPLVGNLEDARDVMQEAAVNLWKKFDENEPPPSACASRGRNSTRA